MLSFRFFSKSVASKVLSTRSAKISPVSFSLHRNGKKINLGPLQKFPQNLEVQKLKLDLYNIEAPVIGECVLPIGKQREPFEYQDEVNDVLSFAMENDPKRDSNKIVNKLKDFEVKVHIIHLFYLLLKNNINPWSDNKKQILTEYKDMFIFLENHGATWDSLYAVDKEAFFDFLQYVFKPPADFLGQIAFTLVSPHLTNEECKSYSKILDELLPWGLNLNALCPFNTSFGSLLHTCIANEGAAINELIDVLESKRNPAKPNTQYNYQQRDAWGKTPLLLAILTLKEQVALKMLDLQNRGVTLVGVNIPDNHGQTPLMLAAALGMEKVFKRLLTLSADPTAKDKNGDTFEKYINCGEKKVKEILMPLLNPDRGEQQTQSYFYFYDDYKTPLCLLENNEAIAQGDEQIKHLVIRSPLPEHLSRINRVIECLEAEIKYDKKNIPAAEKLTEILAIKKELENNPKTVLAACLEKQPAIAKLIKNFNVIAVIQANKEYYLRHPVVLDDKAVQPDSNKNNDEIETLNSLN